MLLEQRAVNVTPYTQHNFLYDRSVGLDRRYEFTSHQELFNTFNSFGCDFNVLPCMDICLAVFFHICCKHVAEGFVTV